MIVPTSAKVSGGLQLIDEVIADSVYEGQFNDIITQFFPNYSANNSVWVIISNGTGTAINNFRYGTGSVIRGNMYSATFVRYNGIYPSNYSTRVDVGDTLQLYAIDFDALLS